MADWDTTNPADNDIVSQFPSNERDARAAARTNFGVDHHETDDGDVGKHEKATLLVQGSAPASAAGQGVVYAKSVGGVVELFYRDSGGTEVQLTSGGAVSALVSGDLAANGGSIPEVDRTNTFTFNQIITGSTPLLSLRQDDETDKNFNLVSNNNSFRLDNIQDDGTFVSTIFQAEYNAARLVLGPTEASFAANVLWHEGNLDPHVYSGLSVNVVVPRNSSRRSGSCQWVDVLGTDSIAGSSRGTWYTPRVTGEDVNVARMVTFHNQGSSAINVRVRVTGFYSSDDESIRLLKNGVVQQTIAGPSSAETFSAVAVSAGDFASFEVEGTIGSGSGDDWIVFEGLWAWLEG